MTMSIIILMPNLGQSIAYQLLERQCLHHESLSNPLNFIYKFDILTRWKLDNSLTKAAYEAFMFQTFSNYYVNLVFKIAKILQFVQYF